MPSCSLFLSPKCSKGSSGIKKHRREERSSVNACPTSLKTLYTEA